jgi:hypothetical protein
MQISDIGVLIIGFKRYQSIKTILEICHRNGVERIYLAIDGPRVDSESDKHDGRQIQLVVEEFRSRYNGKMEYWMRKENVGSAAAVLSACDWAFRNEQDLIVLEDDCIPSDDFFRFCLEGLDVINSNTDIAMVCGSQFIPKGLSKNRWYLSKYPFIWGWATTKASWCTTVKAINEIGFSSRPQTVGLVEYQYWKAGALRALRGKVDAWDTPLAFALIAANRTSIHSPVNLVTNIGSDQAATHTKELSALLHRSAEALESQAADPLPNPDSDLWIKKNIFGISLRHVLTTRLTKARDAFSRNARFNSSLLKRWKAAKQIESIIE